MFDQICKSVFNNFEVLLSKRKELKCKGVGSNLVPSAGEKKMENIKKCQYSFIKRSFEQELRIYYDHANDVFLLLFGRFI